MSRYKSHRKGFADDLFAVVSMLQSKNKTVKEDLFHRGRRGEKKPDDFMLKSHTQFVLAGATIPDNIHSVVQLSQRQKGTLAAVTAAVKLVRERI